jgi:uncharacterized protein YhaN
MATQEVIYDAGVVMSSPDVVELALTGKPNALALFEPNGLDPIIDKIRAEVRSHVSDISTERGRKAIASLSRKVASSRVRLDDLGKELVTDVKAQIGAIDAERKRMRDELDKLRDETRQPLTEWENAEAFRIQTHESGLLQIAQLANAPFNASIEELSERIEAVGGFTHRDWQEFSRRYQLANESATTQLTKLLEETKRRAEEQAELKRLQEAEAKRMQEERETRLQAEAAAKAKSDAEAKARAEAEAEERRQYEAAAKAKHEAEARIKAIEKLAAEEKAEVEARAKSDREYIERQARVKQEAADKARKDAEERTRQIEAEAAKAKAESDAAAKREREAAERSQRESAERTRKAEESAAKAVSDAEQATERERQRVAEDKRLEDVATAKREANKKHRAAINRGAVDALVASAGITEEVAILVVTAIIKGEIPAVRISY